MLVGACFMLSSTLAVPMMKRSERALSTACCGALWERFVTLRLVSCTIKRRSCFLRFGSNFVFKIDATGADCGWGVGDWGMPSRSSDSNTWSGLCIEFYSASSNCRGLLHWHTVQKNSWPRRISSELPVVGMSARFGQVVCGFVIILNR